MLLIAVGKISIASLDHYTIARLHIGAFHMQINLFIMFSCKMAKNMTIGEWNAREKMDELRERGQHREKKHR